MMENRLADGLVIFLIVPKWYNSYPQLRYGNDQGYNADSIIGFQIVLQKMSSEGVNVSQMTMEELNKLFEFEMKSEVDKILALSMAGDLITIEAGGEVIVAKGAGEATYKEVNIHGNINTELDEVDLVNKIIYEDKSAEKLYMENPDFPQTEEQWAIKQIFKKGSNRIDALQQENFNLSSQVSSSLPQVDELKNIRDYVFRIDADTPELRVAVQEQLDKLKIKYPEFNFSATYGGKK